eukprot:gene18669-26399_t
MPIISFGAPCERLSAHQRIHPISQRIQVRNLRQLRLGALGVLLTSIGLAGNQAHALGFAEALDLAAQHAAAPRHRLRPAPCRGHAGAGRAAAPGAAHAMTLLRVENLGKHYGSTPVFANVQVAVAPGEFVAIVGDSGVGKSTLLNCLAGLDTWDTGSITHGTTDLGQLDDTARALWRRAHVGFVFQAFHVLPHLDVAQNVALPLMLLGQTDAARVQHML